MEKEEKRITKRDNYEALKEIVEKSNVENAEMLVEFINKQIEMIDKYNRLQEILDKLEYYAEYIFEDEEELE